MIRFVAVPSELGSLGKNTGCRLAPQKILQKRKCLVFPVDAGDVEKTEQEIFESAKKIFAKSSKNRFVFVGGDHSITYPLFKAFARRRHTSAALLVFDAHADCVQFFKPVSHEDLNRILVQEKWLQPKRLMIVGLRRLFKIEKSFLGGKKIKTISTKKIRNDFEQSKKELSKFLMCQHKVYLSLDIDVLDALLVPGTGYPEKNGLSKKKFLELLKACLASGKIKAIDLVEANPLLDQNNQTIRMAQKIVATIESNWK